MHVPTHILSGWCVANGLPTTPAQRLAAMVAATAADVDGLSRLLGEDAYWTYHHTFGHNVFFAVALSAACAACVRQRPTFTFALCLLVAHLHLVLDYFGSGPGWHVHYLWPFKAGVLRNPNAWPFDSWQNRSAFCLLLAWTLLIAIRRRRTPLERIAPRLDRRLVGLVR